MLKTINILRVTKEAGVGCCFRNYFVDTELVGDEGTVKSTLMLRIAAVMDYALDWKIPETEALARLALTEGRKQYESQVKLPEEPEVVYEGQKLSEAVSTSTIVV